MNIETSVRNNIEAIKFTATEDGKFAGRASLYIIFNDLHAEPYGLLEDVFVDEAFRGRGLGTELVKKVIAEAKGRGCHKLIGTSRHSRKEVHEWYKGLGFQDYGLEFRMDFSSE